MLISKIKYFLFDKNKRPGAANNLIATVAAADQVDLSWSNPDSFATYILIEWGFFGEDYNWSEQISGSLSSYSATGLTTDQEYEFRVTRLNNKYGTSSVLPSTVQATPVGGGK